MKINKIFPLLFVLIALLVISFYIATSGYEINWSNGIKHFLSFLIFFGIFYIINYWSIPALLNGMKTQWIIIPAIFISGFVLLEFNWCIWYINNNYERYYAFRSLQRSINNIKHIPIIIQLCTGMLFSIGIALIMTKINGLTSRKKILKYLNISIIVISLIVTVTFAKQIITNSFKKIDYRPNLTNTAIQFCEPEYNIENIQQILKDCQSTSKPTYVSFWTEGCAWLRFPVINELEKIKTDSIREKINFLYICGESVLSPSGYDVWKRNVENYNITGTHTFLPKTTFEKVFINKYKIRSGVSYGYSMFFDRDGTLILKDAPKANKSEKEKLIRLLNKWTKNEN